ncbi:MAG: hypothetical protein ACJAUV_001975, partial [Flavobacteriales bacterium]
MNLDWNDVSKIIAILSGTGITISAIIGFAVWIFKKWITNLFQKDLKRQEIKLTENLKEKELQLQKDNKETELRLNEEIRKSELQISKLINFEKKHFDVVIESYKSVWIKFMEFEEYVIREYPYYFQGLQTKDTKDYANPIRVRIHAIKKETLFLSKEVNDKVEKLFNDFFIDFTAFMQVVDRTGKGIESDVNGKKIATQEQTQEFSESLNTIQTNLARRIENLREEFRSDFMKEMKK